MKKYKLKIFANKRIIISLIILFLILCLSIWGVKGTFAYYIDSSQFAIMGTQIGDFDTGDQDININIYAEDNDGKYNLIKNIPSMSYVLNTVTSKCDKTDASYTFDNQKIVVKSKSRTTCKFYFDQTAKADIIINLMLEDSKGSHVYNQKNYIYSDTIPSSGYQYSNYVCTDTSAGTTLTYTANTKMFTYKSTKKNTCYAYFIKSAQAVRNTNSISVYVQKAKDSDDYLYTNSLPSSNAYVKSAKKESYCENNNKEVIEGVEINYDNGSLQVDSPDESNCYVYLDLNN